MEAGRVENITRAYYSQVQSHKINRSDVSSLLTLAGNAPTKLSFQNETFFEYLQTIMAITFPDTRSGEEKLLHLAFSCPEVL